MKPVEMKEIQITDPFWKEYMSLVRKHVIPYQWEALNDRIEGANPSYCIQNFKVASGQIRGKFQGMVFQDSDVYKWLEAVAFTLMWHPDEALEKIADEAIDLICLAQQEDGYLDTYYIINGLDQRFTNLKDNHELYCFGHMTEAAVAYYEACGKRKFLDAVIRYASCIGRIFGREEGKLHGYPGHEVAEMALIRLYRVTKDESHLLLAGYFIDERGREPLYFKEESEKNNNTFYWKDSYFQYQYYQAGKEVRKQEKAQGHAVRAVYLYSGMADVALESGDDELLNACKRLWDNMTQKQMYLTGAIGSSEYGEAFTFDYDLPNDTVYGETCASIGLIFFARRMFEATRDSKYTDVLERALYNGVISGMSQDGEKFFYVNPLEVVPEACEKDYNKKHVKYERQKWFGCACCPPNVARLLSSIGSYAYEVLDDTFYMSLYIGGIIETKVNNQTVCLDIQTDYPWDGSVKVRYTSKETASFTYAVRIPGWCSEYKILLNEKELVYRVEKGYALITREWSENDLLRVEWKMEAVLNVANPHIRENIGKFAVSRGPIVYCLEEADNGKELHRIHISGDTVLKESFQPELLKGVVTLTCRAFYLTEENWKQENLYQAYKTPIYKEKECTFIPYYAWANRTPGEMMVWIHAK